MTKLPFAFFGILPLLSSVGFAQHELLLKDHHHLLKGEVVSSTADSVTFEHVVGEASQTDTYKVDQIDAHSFYIIRSHAVGDDAAAKVELGKYCLANGLNTRARNQFSEAQKLDPSLKLDAYMSKAREGTASEMLKEAQDLQAKGDLSGAYRKASGVISTFGGTPSAEKARGLLADVHAKLASSHEARAAAHDAQASNADIQRVQEDLARAKEENTKGMTTKSSSVAKTELKKSIKTYEGALDKLAAMAQSSKDDAKLSKRVADMTTHAKGELIDTFINLGCMYMTQTDYNSALAQVNAALVIDPENPQAKSFRARVATAAGDIDIDVYGPRRGAVRRR